ncbi:MAG: hypothetical protein EZS28_046202, partial [Streblomastix strix]
QEKEDNDNNVEEQQLGKDIGLDNMSDESNQTYTLMEKKKRKRCGDANFDQVTKINEPDSMKEEYEILPVDQRKRRNVDESE